MRNGLANDMVATTAELATREMVAAEFSTTTLLRATTLSAVVFSSMLLKYP
jgi:hypothetical protein